MPHIIVEYSQDSLDSVDKKVLVNTVFKAVVATDLFTVENIKVRLHAVEYYQLGLPCSGFIHVMCRIHTGKTDLQKQQLSQGILQSLKLLLTTNIVMTVEVVEMHKQSYAKSILANESLA